MKFSFIIVFISIIQSCISQNNIELSNKVESIVNISSMPYIPELSGDSLFWNIVKEKKEIIPYLIEKLDDTTITISVVPNFGGYYTVADIANTAISTIIMDFPGLEFIDESNKEIGYFAYWEYVRNDYINRIRYKEKVRYWYQLNESKLIWIEDNKVYRTSKDWKFGNQNPAGGYFIVE